MKFHIVLNNVKNWIRYVGKLYCICMSFSKNFQVGVADGDELTGTDPHVLGVNEVAHALEALAMTDTVDRADTRMEADEADTGMEADKADKEMQSEEADTGTETDKAAAEMQAEEAEASNASNTGKFACHICLRPDLPTRDALKKHRESHLGLRCLVNGCPHPYGFASWRNVQRHYASKKFDPKKDRFNRQDHKDYLASGLFIFLRTIFKRDTRHVVFPSSCSYQLGTTTAWSSCRR